MSDIQDDVRDHVHAAKHSIRAAGQNPEAVLSQQTRKRRFGEVVQVCGWMDLAPALSPPARHKASDITCRESDDPAWIHVLRDLLRSEEHTSELQSLRHLVCRLL